MLRITFWTTHDTIHIPECTGLQIRYLTVHRFTLHDYFPTLRENCKRTVSWRENTSQRQQQVTVRGEENYWASGDLNCNLRTGHKLLLPWSLKLAAQTLLLVGGVFKSLPTGSLLLVVEGLRAWSGCYTSMKSWVWILSVHGYGRAIIPALGSGERNTQELRLQLLKDPGPPNKMAEGDTNIDIWCAHMPKQMCVPTHTPHTQTHRDADIHHPCMHIHAFLGKFLCGKSWKLDFSMHLRLFR